MANSAPDYQLGDMAKVTLDGELIKGLNSIKVPGIQRESVKIDQFGQDFDFEVPTSASWDAGSISGNYIRDDKTGQAVLRNKLFANEGLTGLRMYEDDANFWAVDLAKNPNSQIYVKGVQGVEISKSGVIPFNADLLVQGLLALYNAHIEGDTLSFTSSTIVDSKNKFEGAGFVEGMSILIEGSTSNDNVNCIVTGVAAGTLTVDVKSGVLKSENAKASTKIHGGKF